MAIKAEQILRENIAKIRGNGTDRIYYTPEPPKDQQQYNPWHPKPSESMAAKLLAAGIRNRFAWHELTQQWYRWTGTHWEADADWEVFRYVHDELFNKLEKGPNRTYINNVTFMLRLYSEIKPRSERHLLPFNNIVLNLDTRDVIDHNPNLNLTWRLPYDYNLAADCQTFQKWLHYVTDGNAEIKLLLQAYMNAIVRGYNKRQAYLELIGVGGSGKSTFQQICSLLVGEENTVTTELKLLNQNRFESANLYEKRLVFINDSGKYGGDVDMLKALVGGDWIRYEQKNKPVGKSFKFGGLVVIAANQAIKSTDSTSGLARRRLTVYFDKKIDEAKLPTGYYDKMMDEIPGILNWCLSLSDAEVDGFLNGETTKRCNKIGTVTSTPLAGWMNDRLIYKPGGRLYVGIDNDESRKAGFAYANYVDWCKETGNHEIALRLFSRSVVDLAVNIADHKDVTKEKDVAGAYLNNVVLKQPFSNDGGPFIIEVDD